ncbi:ABC transporter substrate-binding protein [Desulfatiglans anilini]|uniref:ABC transporter substrate-binding protein n=1 Tax=Desulfatiglans anilini TaxID=90728 RepID=UPI00040984DF|nr:ABC transporter substrate-binding protein [Desulfatiglans anilini]
MKRVWGLLRPMSGAVLLFGVLTILRPPIVGPSLLCAAATEEIVLGAPTSLGTLEGAESLKAARLAVDEVNAAGGVRVGGRVCRLRLEPCDLNDAAGRVRPEEAVARLERFIREQAPDVILIGPFRSEVLLASMDLLARHRIPTLVSIAMSPAVDAKILSDPRYRCIFRLSLSTRYLAARLIEALQMMRREFAFDKILILNQDVAWARSTISLLLKVYLDRSDWKVTGQENLSGETVDFSRFLNKARADGAHVILTIFDAPACGNLIEQWHTLKPPAVLCGFLSPAIGPGAWEAFGGRLEGVINVIFELGNLPSSRYAPAAAFYEAFEAAYGAPIEAGHGPAPSYESVYVFAEAIERAGSLEPEGVIAALEATDRQGSMGRLRFHRGHQAIFGEDPYIEALACVVQWQASGRRVIVHPAAIAEGPIALPDFVRRGRVE